MSTGLRSRPASSPDLPTVPPGGGPASAPPAGREDVPLLVAVVALLAAACLPLGRAFVDWSVTRPVLGAVLLAVGLSWGTRRLGAGPIGALLVSVLGWAAFVAGAFLSSTTVLGIVPTPATLEAFPALWAQGIELIRARPAPTLPEPGLLLLTVTGVWAVTHAVDGLVFRLQAPVKAILLALGLWMVPLLVTVGAGPPARWTVPFLAASAFLLLVSAGDDVGRWGLWRSPAGTTPAGRVLAQLLPSGSVIAGAAIIVGVALAASLPGYGEPPWYEVQGGGGTTLTTNPIVTIRASLTATDQGPVMRVATPRPVYLRTTSLDVYEDGGWTNAGIRGTPVDSEDGHIRPQSPVAGSQEVAVEVEVENLPEAVLVPAPYQPVRIAGDAASGFQYDQRLATLTTARGTTLEAGDRYRVDAVIPDPDPGVLLQGSPRREDTALPANVAPEVAALARRVVDEAGAVTPLEQALAIQDEFQSERWTYSLDPPSGHGTDAMLDFINHRVGYCEQYAGTMAVMLRTLNIPARVAVGFTPGEPEGEGTYVVTNGNAHAWVEVSFPGHGWVAFEPTPRDDGNVLAPSLDSLAPPRTLAEEAAAEPVEVPEPPAEPDVAGEPAEPDDAEDPEAADQADGADPESDDEAATVWLLVGLLAGLVGLGAAVAAGRRRRVASSRTPIARVIAAREGVERIGRGLGIRAAAWETDDEYLGRLSSSVGTAEAAAATLGDRSAQARYAREVPVAAAEDAEAAAGALSSALLAGKGAGRRALVMARGTRREAVARLGETRVVRRVLRRGPSGP